MNDLVLLFAVHNHQPVGNFPSIFKSAFESCYRPLLEGLAGHPGFRFALHFSGPLWEYMEKNERTCWDLVRELAGRGQVELLSGGFYEPILYVIPEEDRIGQVRMMNDFLAESFGQRPRGLWLTERVWEGRGVYEAKRNRRHYFPLLTGRLPGFCKPLSHNAKPHSKLSMPRPRRGVAPLPNRPSCRSPLSRG